MIPAYGIATLFSVTFLIVATAFGEPSGRGLEFSGSLYSDFGLFHYMRDQGDDSAAFSGVGVLATRFKNVNREYAKVEGDFEFILPYGAAAGLFPQADSGLTSGPSPLFESGATPLVLDMRKLYLEAYLPYADIAIGRQIVNFGSGFLFSPIDVFSTVQLSDLNFRRNGSDVACVRLPLGDLAGIDAIAEAPVGDNEHSSATRLFANIAGWDMSAVGLYRHRSDELIVGATFKGDALAGLYGELVEHRTIGTGNRYFEGMIGADYSIRNIWFFNAEYLYRDCSSDSLSLWGRNNLYSSIQFAPNELTRLAATIIHQFEEQLTIGMVSWYYSLLQNADLTAYVRGYDNLPSTGAPDLQYSVRIEVKF
jgi:hypothetical protein